MRMKPVAIMLALAFVLAVPACREKEEANPQPANSEARTGIVVDKRFDPAVTTQSRTCASYTTNKKGVRTCARYTTKAVTTDDADWILVVQWSDGGKEDVDVEQAEYDRYQVRQAYP